ncbi:MAG: CinA family protein [Erysipelotrichaceae bacterium]
MEELLNLLRSLGLSMSCCESFTGGLFATRATAIAGASDVFLGGIIAYSNDIKANVLHIDPKILAEYGAISAQTVEAMAINAQVLFKSDLCVSFSGNAGPAVMEDKKNGEAYMCIVYRDVLRVYHDVFRGSREDVRYGAVDAAIRRIKELVREVTEPCEKGVGG